MGSYAKKTSVPVDRSRQEIEHVLTRYGADEFFYGKSSKGAGIGFKHNNRVIKIGIPFPNEKDFNTETKYNQEYRRRWRVLIIALKAKLELIDADLSTFEDEFLAQTCLPDGSTVSSHIRDEIDTLLQEKKMPKALLPEF